SLHPLAETRDWIRKLPAPRTLLLSPENVIVDNSPPLHVQIANEKPPEMKPISEERHVLKVTVGNEFVAKLERAKEALSHKIPSGNMEEVLLEGLRMILEREEKRRGAQTQAKQRKQK